MAFVTSIATGILTVTFLQDAPATVTQTINRVVERTVERVVQPTPVETKTTTSVNPGKVIVERETVVVKEDELIPKSVERNGASIVRIMRKGTEAGATERFLSLGLIVSKEGLLLAPRVMFDENMLFSAVMLDGSRIPISFATTSQTLSRFSLLSLVPAQGSSTVFSAASLGLATELRLGQSVIGIGGRDRNVVSVGIVSALDEPLVEGKRQVSAIDTDLQNSLMVSGAPLVTLSGTVVGLLLSDDRSGVFIPIDEARTLFSL